MVGRSAGSAGLFGRLARVGGRVGVIVLAVTVLFGALGSPAVSASSADARFGDARRVLGGPVGVDDAIGSGARSGVVGRAQVDETVVPASSSGDVGVSPPAGAGPAATMVAGGSVSTVAPGVVADGSLVTIPPTDPRVAPVDPLAVVGEPVKVPVLVDELSSETTEVWRQPDGSYTAEVTAGPVRVKGSDGVWRPIDVSLVATASGWEPVRPVVPVRIGRDPGTDFVSVGEGGAEVRFSYPEGAGKQIGPDDLAGGVLGGVDVLGSGRDLRIEMRADGFKEIVVVRDRLAGGSYLTRIGLPAGGSARQSEDGLGVEVLDAKGSVLGVYGGGPAWDSSSDIAEKRSGSQVGVKLISVVDGVALVEVSVDAGWFDAAVLPVTIDPYWTAVDFLSSEDQHIRDSSSPSDSDVVTGDEALSVGLNPVDDLVYRAHVRFDLSFIRSAHTQINAATMKLWQFNAESCDPFQVEVQGFATWPAPTSSWASEQNKLDSYGPFSAPSFNKGGSGCDPPGWVEFDAAEITDRWIWPATNNGGEFMNGVRIRAADETSTAAFKRFRSRDYLDPQGQPLYPPSLNVSFHVVNEFEPPGSTFLNPDGAYGASYGLSRVWSRLPGRQVSVDVPLRNLGWGFVWDWTNVRLDYEVKDSTGQSTISSGVVSLPAGTTVSPGQQYSLKAAIDVPETEGGYQIWWDMEHLFVCNPPAPSDCGRFSWRGVVPGVHVLLVSPAAAFGVDPNQPLHNGVNLVIGNYQTSVTDASVPTVGPGLALNRSYNSLNRSSGEFGFGWSWTYGMRVVVPVDDPKTVEVYYPDGRRETHRLAADGSGAYQAPLGSAMTIVRGFGGWVLTDGTHSTWHFDGSFGLLDWIVDEQGRLLTFTTGTTGGKPFRKVRSANGRTLTLEYTAGLIDKVVSEDPDPAAGGGGADPLVWTYHYQGAGWVQLLDRVCGPDHEISGAGADMLCWDYDYDATARLERIIPPASGAGNVGTARIGYGNTSASARVTEISLFYDGIDRAFYRYDYGMQAADVFRATVWGPKVSLPTIGDTAAPKIEVRYDEAGRLIRHQNQAGDSRWWFYGDTKPSGRCGIGTGAEPFVCEVQDESGNIVEFDTDARGNVLRKRSRRDPATLINEYWAYETDRVIAYRDGRSGSSADNTYLSAMTWYGRGLKAVEQGPAGRPTGSGLAGDSPSTQTRYAYSGSPAGTPGLYGSLLIAEDSHKYPSTLNDLPAGLLLEEIHEGGATDHVTHYFYSDKGDLTRVVTNVSGAALNAPDAFETRYSYDDLGRKISEQVYADGWWSGTLDTSFEYGPQGFVRQITEPGVQETVDQVGSTLTGVFTHRRRIEHELIDAEGHILRAVEHDLGSANPVDADRVTTRSYDLAGREKSVTDPAGGVLSRTYDLAGGVATVTDQNGVTTRTVYDSRGVPTDIFVDDYCINPLVACTTTNVVDLRTHRYAYDANGRRTSDTDALGRVRVSEYFDDGLIKREYLQNYAEPDPGSGPDTTIAVYVLGVYGYDNAGRLTTKTANGSVQTSVYDNAGRLAYQKLNTATERRTFYTYDTLGRVTIEKHTEAALNPSQDPADTTIRVEQVTNGYDIAGRLTCRAVENGATDLYTRATYDNRGLKISETAARGNTSCTATPNAAFTSTFSYDQAGRLRVATSPPLPVDGVSTNLASAETRAGYDTWGNTTRAKDANGNLTTSDYDKLNRKTKVTYPHYTPPVVGAATIIATERWAYDAVGNQTCWRNRYGAATGYEYTALNQAYRSRVYLQNAAGGPFTTCVIAATDPIYSTGSTVYTKTGRPATVTNTKGGTTNYLYDKLDRLETSTLNIGAFADGAPTTAPPNATSVRSDFGYDRAGNQIWQRTSSTNGDRLSLTAYNQANEAVTVTDPLGNKTEIRYDVAGRVLRAYETYDPTVTSMAQTRHVQHRYDPAGREIDTRDVTPAGTTITTHNSYDKAGNLAFSWNPNEVAAGMTFTNWARSAGYDAADRLSTLTINNAPYANSISSYGYDLGGNTTRISEPRNAGDTNPNHVIQISYNSWNQQERYTEPSVTDDPALLNGTAESQYQRMFITGYDPAGAPAHDLGAPITLNAAGRVSAAGVALHHTYDRLGRLTTTGSVTNLSTGAETLLRTFGYDQASNMISADVNFGRGLTFAYDNQSELRRAEDDGTLYESVYRYGDTGEFSYRQDTISDPTVTSYSLTATYTARGELATLADTMSSRTRTYGWRPDHRLGTVTTRQSANNVLVGERAYSYLEGRLLTDESIGNAGQTVASRSYQYDYNGNIVTEYSNLGLDGGVHVYVYDTASRLSQWQYWSGEAVRIDDYYYDPNGNRTNVTSSATQTGSVSTDYIYDRRNRLARSSDGTTTTNYAWTPRGTLASTQVGSAPVVTSSFNALGQLTNQNGTSYEYDALDRVANRTNTAITKKFSYVGGQIDPAYDGTIRYMRSPAGRPIAAKKGVTVRLPELDRHGDLTALLNPTTGDATDLRAYDPWGEPHNTSGTFAPSIGYQGDYTDPTTDQVWMGARWYTPGTATFTSRDTYAGQTSNPISLNRYTYASNNPIRYWDPDGHWSAEDGLAIRDATLGACWVAAANGQRSPGCDQAVDAIINGSSDVSREVFDQGPTAERAEPVRTTPEAQALAVFLEIVSSQCRPQIERLKPGDSYRNEMLEDCIDATVDEKLGETDDDRGWDPAATAACSGVGGLRNTSCSDEESDQLYRNQEFIYSVLHSEISMDGNSLGGFLSCVGGAASGGWSTDEELDQYRSDCRSGRNISLFVINVAFDLLIVTYPATGGGSRLATEGVDDLVRFDPQFASRQIAGQNLPGSTGYATTPGGNTLSVHAAERTFLGGPGRAPIDPSLIDDILAQGTRVTYRGLNDTVRVGAPNLCGTCYVVVDAETGTHVVTVMVPK